MSVQTLSTSSPNCHQNDSIDRDINNSNHDNRINNSDNIENLSSSSKDDKIDPALNSKLNDNNNDNNNNNNKDFDDVVMHDSKDDPDTNNITNLNSSNDSHSLFISHLSTLNNIITENLIGIDTLYPHILNRNYQLKRYIDYISSHDFIQFVQFLEKLEHNDLDLSNDDNEEELTTTTNTIPVNSSDPSRAMQARINSVHASLYQQQIPCIPGTRIPDIDLNNQAKTVKDVWDEWTIGHKNKPPLSKLEKTYGTRWRRGRIAKSAQRRKKIIEFIENEYRKHANILKNINVVVKDLEQYRISKGKGLFWLYGALPDKLYNDAGEPLFKTDNKESQTTNNNKDETSIGDNNTSVENIDDHLKNVDAVEKERNGDDTSMNLVNEEEEEDDDEAVVRNAIDRIKQQENRNDDDDDDDDEDDDDDDDDDDDGVNMQSVADVAAMAALTVEGEDDDHALVNSAALAAAAQHVADQQRRRYQQKKFVKPVTGKSLKNLRQQKNDDDVEIDGDGDGDVEIDSQSRQSMSEFINEDNTDPALSKL
ncbi:hypothetical protein CANINC_000890 [Pichia inconspicua]|uniref:Transcription activator GCR1-like domain-containing protein n=1 Tax=Pichia inconspicua TaxID=52247 RepID=A0A4T0X4Z5_9ASCO|nr:hypothetical protein CANINC_000890 [[Candida] inconspicua]